MSDLETQVAKIQIGNFKQTTAYVFLLAEKAQIQGCELYVVAELPLFNPAALQECERIAQSVSASLKRTYRRGIGEGIFEQALEEINEELGKLASMGKTNWVGKLNAVVAAKQGSLFNIASTGKVNALLLREGQFAEIVESVKAKHPLKTFENFATGKLHLHDIIVLSTAELFNNMSADRLKNILEENALGIAAQEIVRILEDIAGPEIAFGTLLVSQVEPSAGIDEDINLEEYLTSKQASSKFNNELAKKVVHKFKNVFALHKVRPVLHSARNLFKNRPTIKLETLAKHGKNSVNFLTSNSKAWKEKFNTDTFLKFSPQKKFFFISAVVLLLAVFINIFAARYFTKTKEANSITKEKITQVQKLINDANSSLVYDNDSKARELTLEISKFLAEIGDPSSEKDVLKKIKSDLEELRGKIDKNQSVEPVVVATLSSVDSLISLPEAIGTASGTSITSYNKKTGGTEDGSLKTPVPIVKSVWIKNSTIVGFDGQGFEVIDIQKNSSSQPFYQNVPKPQNLAGIAFYPINNRIYALDNSSQTIYSYQVSDQGINKPTLWTKNGDGLKNGVDLAVDGNIYVLTSDGILKFQQGRQVDFKQPQLLSSLSGKGKIYTNKDLDNIFILDIGKNRVVIIDKKGNVIKTLTSPKFTNVQDFSVDEKNSSIFILNNGSLLKFGY